MHAMPMRPTTIRFAPDAMELVNDAAKNLGVSVAQFVRESAIMRAMLVEGKGKADLMALADQVTHLARRDDP